MASAEQQMWQALIGAGLSSNQAAGVMGNAENESDFNVEARALDTNGRYSDGMIQWNEASYPNASSLVTGNVSKDLTDQVNFLLHNTNNVQKGLSGSSAAQIAGNWAQYVEVCAGCQPGGTQYNERVANAQQVLSDAQSGNWPQSNKSATSASLASNPVSDALGSVLGGLGSSFLGSLGVPNFKDMMERLGLILLGAALILLGIHMLRQNIMGGNKFNITTSKETDESGNRTNKSIIKTPVSSHSRTVRTASESTGAKEAIEAAAIA